MKKYINTNFNEKQYIIGNIPEGWREMTDSELQQDEAFNHKLDTLENEWLALPKGIQSFFKNNYDDVKAALQAGNKAEAVQIMADIEPLIPDSLKHTYKSLADKVKEF